jgi:hypothetical protein
VDGCRRCRGALGIDSAVPAIAALLGFGALFGTIAALRFRWD